MVRELKVYEEAELREPVDLCLTGGRLNREAVGWSRRPLHNCNLSGSLLRKKRWNYWCITTDHFLFSVTLSNIDYMGLAFIYFLDFKSKFFHEKTVIRPFGKGFDLGNLVADDAVFEDPQLAISMLTRTSGTAIKVHCPDFQGQQLTADLLITPPADHQTLNVVIPWSDSRFQFTSKQHCLPVAGDVILGEKTYSTDSGYACLDFGRGIWPFSSFWNWAGGSGKSDGHLVGLNLGAGWTDGTGMNENGIVIDGVLNKISEDLVFDYNPAAFMQPWKIHTHASEMVSLTFTPFFERVAKTNALVLRSEVHQMIGHFSGTVQDHSGNSYQLADLIGWAEEHYARW
jgi:hypothetical protein